MDELSPDQLRQLCCFPPFFCDYEDAVLKHFGDDPPDTIYDFLNDIVEFQRNLGKVKCEQDNISSNSELCTQCKRTHESINIINKHVQCLTNDVTEMIKKVLQLKCKEATNPYFSLEDESVNDVIDFSRNLLNHVEHLKELLEIIQICKVKE